jgi:hypothetical protein
MFLSADAHRTEADAMKQKSADAGMFIRRNAELLPCIQQLANE